MILGDKLLNLCVLSTLSVIGRKRMLQPVAWQMTSFPSMTICLVSSHRKRKITAIQKQSSAPSDALSSPIEMSPFRFNTYHRMRQDSVVTFLELYHAQFTWRCIFYSFSPACCRHLTIEKSCEVDEVSSHLRVATRWTSANISPDYSSSPKYFLPNTIYQTKASSATILQSHNISEKTTRLVVSTEKSRVHPLSITRDRNLDWWYHISVATNKHCRKK